MSLRTFTKNTSYVLIARIMTLIMASGSMIFLVRYLGPEKLGLYSFAVTILFLLKTISDPGVSMFLTKEMAQNREDISRLFNNHFILQLIISIIMISIVGFLAFYFSSIVLTSLILIGLIGVFFNNLIFPFVTVLNALEDMKYNTLNALLVGVSTVLITFSGIYLNYGLYYFMLLTICPSFITLNITVWFSRKYIKFNKKYQWAEIRRFLRSSLPFFALTASGLLYSRVDLIMIKIMDSNSAAGLYNASYKIIFFLFIVPIAVRSAIYPMLSNYHANNQDKVIFVVSKTIKFLLLFATLITSIVFLESHPIIVFLFGNKFGPSINCLKILIWMFVPYCAYIVTMFHLNSAGDIKYVMKVSFLGLITNILLNFFLIPTYSIYGVAMATVITEIIVLIGLSLRTFNEYSKVNEGMFFFKLIFTNTSGILIASFLPIYSRGIFFAVYFILLVFQFRLVNKNEKEILYMIWDSFADKFRKNDQKKSIL